MSYRQHGTEPKGAGLSRIFFLVGWILPLLQATSGIGQDPQPSRATESAAAVVGPKPVAEQTFLAGQQTFLIAAQTPSAPERPLSAAEPSTLAFEQTRFTEVRAGHVTLAWQPLPVAGQPLPVSGQPANGADPEIEYRVRDESGAVLYRGEFPRAFISGLPDGTHRFDLDAFDGDGNLVASAAEPALVEVSHWPMPYAWASFAAGSVVVATLLFVIIGGALKSRREQLERVAAGGRPDVGDSSGALGGGAN